MLRDKGRDTFEDMVGGYAPDRDTPTHIFGRVPVRRLKTRKVASRRRKPRRKVESMRVAPGVRVAWEIEEAENEELAQTTEPYDEPDSSLTDQRIIGKQKISQLSEGDRVTWYPYGEQQVGVIVGPSSRGSGPSGETFYDVRVDAWGEWGEKVREIGDDILMKEGQTNPGDVTHSPEEKDLSMGEVPEGDDLMTGEDLEIAPDMEMEINEAQEHAMSGGPQTSNPPPKGRAGFSGLGLVPTGIPVVAEDNTLAEEREEEKEDQMEPDPEEAFATDGVKTAAAGPGQMASEILSGTGPVGIGDWDELEKLISYATGFDELDMELYQPLYDAVMSKDQGALQQALQSISDKYSN